MQKRAEITREALLLAAAAVFTRVGYADARLNTITTRAQVSKGALYDHFSSKEELARAVIEAGSTRFQIACRPFLTSRIPAFKALIGISCLLVDPAVNDTMVRATFRLLTEIPDRPGAETTLLPTWLSHYRELARRALTEGDLRDEDPDAVALLLVDTLAGARILAAATGHLDDLPVRVAATWDLLLPGLVDATKLDHFRELVTRQVARVGDRGTPPQPLTA
ncbi:MULTISPECIES: TetR/AcrR family transcriptional regulator [unclassified Rhodococcus (in: high G+C Gram-positive bacteria)]|uniref:TetR/AcrR family transcriptional regulator n=1 Tax=unclassified Rhodococcus (in: high G+C Gram-positive bacteria) TaxID=192944 RepID=UPI00035C7F17|nr:TetR/AcrR family transcriptional regulator [Rhodococcus sp. DK17]